MNEGEKRRKIFARVSRVYYTYKYIPHAELPFVRIIKEIVQGTIKGDERQRSGEGSGPVLL